MTRSSAPDEEVDVTDPDAIARSVGEAGPDVLYHLAGLAHVGRSWSEPAVTFRVNALGSLNVLEAAAGCESAATGDPRQFRRGVRPGAGSRAGPGVRRAPAAQPYAASKVAAEFVGIQECLGPGAPGGPGPPLQPRRAGPVGGLRRVRPRSAGGRGRDSRWRGCPGGQPRGEARTSPTSVTSCGHTGSWRNEVSRGRSTTSPAAG